MLSSHFFVAVAVASARASAAETFVDKWAVHVKGGKHVADAVAAEHGFRNIGQIGSIADHYHFQHRCDEGPNCIPKNEHSGHHTARLLGHPHVHWAEQQRVRHRPRRSVLPAWRAEGHDANATEARTRRLVVNDPMWDNQWYLHGTKSNDINVQGAWAKGYTGAGVVVTVVDDGIEHTHPDLQANYDPTASTDINGGDDDPFPNEADPINKHGTRCCGEIASLKNDVCGIGIAFGCKIGAVRMLDGDVTDSVEAHSLSLAPQHIDIYSNSWGPNDDGRTIEGPAALAQKAIEDGIATGRGGKGSIYVFASGNGGASGDSCNCDGYCNSIYTIAIGAITEDNGKPYYTEPCTATLASTYSSGSGRQRSIATVDLHGGCTARHSGTSAAAPLAAGIFALVLEANPSLTWRDLQHLVVQTSRKIDPDDLGWRANGVGRRFNPKYGYGALDATALVVAAETWSNVAPAIVDRLEGSEESITATGGTLTVTEASTFIRKLEHVQVTVDLETSRRGQTAVHVVCPSGTRSELMPFRHKDTSSQPLQWTYMTVECWDESPVGVFRVEIATQSGAHASLRSWALTLHGTSGEPVVSTPAPTEAPSTPMPSTAPSQHPTTAAPVTAAPTTATPTTAAPTTRSPVTHAPTTLAPGVDSASSGSFAPTTGAPITLSPTTPAPVTAAPRSSAPTTPIPVEVACEEARCDPGRYQIRLHESGPCFGDRSVCKACPPGHVCKGDSAIAEPCGLGHFGGTSALQCFKCQPGYYQDTLASTACKTVNPGYYGFGGTFESREGVRLCEPGHFCPGGKSQPVECPKDTAQSRTGQTQCVPCQSGTHQPKFGQLRCVALSAAAAEPSKTTSVVAVGAVAGGIAGLSIVVLVILVARSCRTQHPYAIATAEDRFSIDDHDSDEVDEDFDPNYPTADPAGEVVSNRVLTGMKDALGSEDSDEWTLPNADDV
eukprot:m.438547 g.438547  ORF g.438547 m.438547 type:complete len:950 (-) comp18255_c0_seq1:61-2910(-)